MQLGFRGCDYDMAERDCIEWKRPQDSRRLSVRTDRDLNGALDHLSTSTEQERWRDET
jgi:hypothetical protein